MQGIMVVAFVKQNFNVIKPEANQFLRLEFYEKFEDMLTHVNYQADKCEFKQQGEVVAKESLEK